MSKPLLIALVGFFLCASVFASEVASKDLPQDVQDIMKRKFCCGHWSSESVYDRDPKDIEAALKKCSCSQFYSDLSKIQIKYKAKKNILQSIENADDGDDD